MIPWRLIIGLGGLVAIVGALWLHLASDARTARDRDNWKQSSIDWQAAATAHKARAEASERAREADQDLARQAQNNANAECDARVSKARSSAKVIKEIVNVPAKTDAAGCPVRTSVDAQRLRDALQPSH